MAQPTKDNKVLISGKDVHATLLDGAKAQYESVATTYGLKGLNVLIEMPMGRPKLTRDGVTVAKEVYFSERGKNMGAGLVSEASQTTNRLAGDGTSATAILTYFLYEQAVNLIATGVNPMSIRETLNNDALLLIEELKKHTHELTDGQLEQVATISSGDSALGKLISGALEHVGLDGGIIAEKGFVDGVEREYIKGYYMNDGFTAMTEGKKELQSPIVFVTAKKISSNSDFLELMEKIVVLSKEQKPRVAFVGEVEGLARESIIANINKGTMDAVIIKAPSSGDMAIQYLEDIALYCGSKVLAVGSSIKDMDSTHLGKADRVVCTPYTSSIFGGASDKKSIDDRVEELKKRIETEESDHLTEKFRDRVAKLQGKVAVFKIGGATETEKEEKEFRIEDAIQATRAAMQTGVVAGGGTTLLRLSLTAGLSEIMSRALQNVFKRLMTNAGLSSEVMLNRVLSSDAPMGINLRGTDELVDLVKEGVLDPALVLQQIIKNAVSTAGNMATIGLVITFEDKDD